MTTATAARATWARATARIGAGEYRSVRFVLRDGYARVFDSNGNLLAQAEPVEVALDRRSAFLTFEDASTWNIEKAKGCGCGGG